MGVNSSTRSRFGVSWNRRYNTAPVMPRNWTRAARAEGLCWIPNTAFRVLGWDASSRWEPLGAGEVARVLLLNALLPESSPAGRRQLLGAASRLLSSVETARLVFSRDGSAADVVRAGLERR
jgi:hypothetical protein